MTLRLRRYPIDDAPPTLALRSMRRLATIARPTRATASRYSAWVFNPGSMESRSPVNPGTPAWFKRAASCYVEAWGSPRDFNVLSPSNQRGFLSVRLRSLTNTGTLRSLACTPEVEVTGSQFSEASPPARLSSCPQRFHTNATRFYAQGRRGLIKIAKN